MKVEQLMTRDVCACHPQQTMRRAAQIFWEHDCGCAPVTDEDSRVVGIITDRDICIAAYTQGRTLDEMPIASAMATRVHSCEPTDTVAVAEQIMRKNGVRRLPVVDKAQRLVGVLSLNDIAQEAARERSGKVKVVTDVEVGETLASVCTPRRPAPVGNA